MWAVYAGPLKSGIREKLNEFYDRPFDVFVSYYDTGIYRLPHEWEKEHGPYKQMDWGSWLYICDKAGLGELLNPGDQVTQVIPADGQEKYAKRLPAIEAGEIPEDEWYGVLEVECY